MMINRIVVKTDSPVLEVFDGEHWRYPEKEVGAVALAPQQGASWGKGRSVRFKVARNGQPYLILTGI